MESPCKSVAKVVETPYNKGFEPVETFLKAM